MQKVSVKTFKLNFNEAGILCSSHLMLTKKHSHFLRLTVELLEHFGPVIASPKASAKFIEKAHPPEEAQTL